MELVIRSRYIIQMMFATSGRCYLPLDHAPFPGSSFAILSTRRVPRA